MTREDFITNYQGLNNAFISGSGAQGVKAALKLSRNYGKLTKGTYKNLIIYMGEPLHGSLLRELHYENKPIYNKHFMAPKPRVMPIKLNDIKALEDAMNQGVCGVIISPFGHSDDTVVQEEFIQRARELCDKYDALLIFDEIQREMALDIQSHNIDNLRIVPDILCTAKDFGTKLEEGIILAADKAAWALQSNEENLVTINQTLAYCAG